MSDGKIICSPRFISSVHTVRAVFIQSEGCLLISYLQARPPPPTAPSLPLTIRHIVVCNAPTSLLSLRISSSRLKSCPSSFGRGPVRGLFCDEGQGTETRVYVSTESVAWVRRSRDRRNLHKKTRAAHCAILENLANDLRSAAKGSGQNYYPLSCRRFIQNSVKVSSNGVGRYMTRT